MQWKKSTFTEAGREATLPSEGYHDSQAEATHRGSSQVGQLEAKPHDSQPTEQDSCCTLEAVVPDTSEAADEAAHQA